jgi:hypothetical protein
VLFSVLSDFSLVDCTINYLDTGVGDLVYYDLILPEFDYTYNFNITNGSELKVIEYDRYVAFNSWYNASLSTYIESSSLEVGASASNQYCYLDYFGYQLDYEGQKLDVGDIVEFKFTVTALNSNESKFKLRFYYFPGGEVISNEVTLTSGSNTAIFTINKEWDEEVYLQLVSTAATSSNVILSNGTMTKYSRGTIRNFRYDTDLSKYVIRFQTTIDDLLDTGSADIEFVNDTYIGNTIVYNDMLQVFTGFYDFIPTMYIERPSNYLTSSTLTDLYLHNTGNYGEYYKDLYNTSSVRESKILIPVNKDFYYTKVFDNLRFSTTSIDDDGINRFYDSTGVYDTFDKLRVYNDYQNSDFVVLDTINTDISRREREWTLSLPRNAVSLSETTSPNIFDSTNLNTTRLFRERIRGKYIILELVYNNLEGYKFNCPYVITKYRKSKR